MMKATHKKQQTLGRNVDEDLQTLESVCAVASQRVTPLMEVEVICAALLSRAVV